jgi:tripartite ATP-independent transporter DctM subunit
MEGIMDNLLVVASMFPVLFFLIFMGFPVSFCFIGLSLFYSLGFFGSAIGMQLVGRVYDVGTNYSYAAIPLFIFMGTLLEHSGIAERLFGAINLWTGRIPGGLAVSTIIMSAIIAAASGIIGAVEVLVGLLAIPAMIKYSYDKGLISGTICAGGALGTIIPPSLVAVVYAPIANVSMGALLIGIIAPGLMLACIYIIYILVRCTIYPEDGPRVSKEEMLKYSFKEKMSITLKSLIPPFMLIFAVMGSIIMGLAPPTEAASLGAFGALLLCIVYRKFNLQLLIRSILYTLKTTSMIMFIIVGGIMFSGVFLVNGGQTLIEKAITGLEISPNVMIMLFIALTFLSGFVLDCFSMILVLVPIFAPLVAKAGMDTLWFAVLFMIVIQTSYLTPPMAPSIFYLKGIAPKSITTQHMFKGIAPYIILQCVIIIAVWIFPSLATWLPSQLLGFK